MTPGTAAGCSVSVQVDVDEERYESGGERQVGDVSGFVVAHRAIGQHECADAEGDHSAAGVLPTDRDDPDGQIGEELSGMGDLEHCLPTERGKESDRCGGGDERWFAPLWYEEH